MCGPLHHKDTHMDGGGKLCYHSNYERSVSILIVLSWEWVHLKGCVIKVVLE